MGFWARLLRVYVDLRPLLKDSLEMMDHIALEQTVQRTGIRRCLECGKCTAICPLSHHDHLFSPRRTVGRALMRRDEELLADERLWACLTCMHCSQVCPAGVAYADLTLEVRTEAHKLGRAVACTHGEVIHSWMRMMMDPALQQNRLGWLADGVQTADSDTLYFVGCAPYFDAQFGHMGVDGGAVARATVQALNALGINPQVLADERCCGHDLLWEGDVDGFRRLAELNADLIRQSGARRVVTSCPECARTLKVDYAAFGIKLDAEVLHFAELMARENWSVKGGQSPFANRRATYHDPCRLGRHLGVYDAPRQVLERIGLELVEMPRHRENALCCGTNGWTHCGAANKMIQAERLREAQATGADLLVTACLKCQIHFRCAMQDGELGDQLDLELMDLAMVVAAALSERLSGDSEPMASRSHLGVSLGA
jgi:Fe-S oxidoreductase